MTSRTAAEPSTKRRRTECEDEVLINQQRARNKRPLETSQISYQAKLMRRYRPGHNTLNHGNTANKENWTPWLPNRSESRQPGTDTGEVEPKELRSGVRDFLGPKGRYSVATSVRAWGRNVQRLQARRADTFFWPNDYSAPSALVNLRTFDPRPHGRDY